MCRSATVKQSVHSKAEDGLFGASLFAGTAACTTILHGFYWQVMGSLESCREVCLKMRASAKVLLLQPMPG